jgi:sulfotransferase
MSYYEQFVCLSGLPRSGSTLLSAILSQNPLIHAEGNSCVCQLMWDMQQSCNISSKEQLAANNRQYIMKDLISEIPRIYYKNNNINEKIIVDKCRSWTIQANIELLRKYVDNNIKIIVLERPIIEIITSFSKLYTDNKRPVDLHKFLQPNSEPIMRSISGINWAKKNNTFLFISYKELINNTEETINKIYTFCGWEPYNHDYNNIVSKYPENDEIYNLKGQHKIRSRIKQRDINITLPEDIVKQCNIIDKLMNYT